LNEFPPPKYVFTMVTNKQLTPEDLNNLFETLAVTKKTLTSAIRKVTDEEWDKMFEVLNKVNVL